MLNGGEKWQHTYLVLKKGHQTIAPKRTKMHVHIRMNTNRTMRVILPSKDAGGKP
jgi:hypothetical protein